MSVKIITGPPTSRVSKAEAEAQLVKHPQFPKGAEFALDEVEGHWIAAFTTESAPPFGGPDEGAPEAPAPDGPPSEGPPGDEAPEAPSDDAPSDDSEGDDKPKGDKKEKGEKGEIKQVLDMLTTLCTALGIAPGAGEDSPVPGLDGPQDGPPGPPPGDVGPPSPDGPHDDKQHMVHERALKPGEAPPGTTPVGAPAFASTHPNHPWAQIIDQKRSFKVEEAMEEGQTLAAVVAELQGLAKDTGYSVKQLQEGEVNGVRTARALISK